MNGLDDAGPFHPPFSYETLHASSDDRMYRVRDARDSAVCRTYVEENAVLVVRALNRLAGVGQ